MVKKVLFFVFVVGMLAGVTWAQPNIVFVSFHGADDVASAGAAGAGFTEAADKGYTDLLKANGYNVTRYVTTATPDAEVLNAADLVIISRSVNSGNYQNAAATAWNSTISAPMIIMGGYALRNSRMGFMTGATIPDTAGDITLAVSDPTHPIFAGIPLTDGTMTNPFAGIVVYPTDGVTVARGISIVTDPADDEGTVLATVATDSDPAVGGMVIGEWSAGATLEHSGGAGTDVLAGNRLVFLSGSREANGISSETAGMFDLYADGAQLFLNAVDYMIPIVPVDPGTDNLLAYYKLDGDVLDSSGNALDGTIVGDPTFVAGTIGMALQLDGVDDAVDLGNDPKFDLTEQVTLATWINTQDIGTLQNNPWVGKGDTSYMLKGHRVANQIEFFVYDGGWMTAHTDAGDSFNGEWHHAAGTYDGMQLKIYVDGQLTADSVTDYVGGISVSTYNVSIGTNSQASGRFTNSALDDVRIYDTALSAAEIAYLADASAIKGLTHLYTFEDGTANDSVGDADGTLVGGAAIVAGAMVTTAQDQWMEMPGDVIAMNTYSEVTVEAWYIPTAGANTSWSMLAYFGDSTDPDPSAGVGNDGFFITSARGDDKSRAAISIGDPASPWASETGADGPEYDDGLLHQMASTINATDITLYIDGALIAATPLAAHNSIAGISTNYALLAKGGYGGDPEWIGEIEEFRIYNRALSAGELAASYATGPEKVGPQPIDPGTDGLVAYYPLDSAGRSITKDASGNGNDGAIVGDPVFVAGVVGNALEFSGDDYVDCGNSPAFDVTDAITIATWVNIRSIPQAWTAVIAKGNSAWRISNRSTTTGMHFGFEDGSRGWQAANSATELNMGEWYHVCGVYDITVGAKIYINGVEDGSNEDTQGITHSDYNVTIGENLQSLNCMWDGAIDEVMIYNRPLSDLEVAFLAGQ